MPCRSDYMEANALEIESRAVANHLIYVFTKLKQTANITPEIKAASTNYYGDVQKLDVWTALLCSTLRGLSQADTDAIVYNAKDACSRSLADWWERHQAWDLKREADEKKKKADEKKKLEKDGLLKAFYALPKKKQEELLKNLGVK